MTIAQKRFLNDNWENCRFGTRSKKLATNGKWGKACVKCLQTFLNNMWVTVNTTDARNRISPENLVLSNRAVVIVGA